MGQPTGYRILSYGDMITDRPRMDAYAQALRQAVRPGCVVLDIGAGTGIFSLLACQFGAGQVHAVEPNDAIELARTMAAANGCADRITFHQKLSTALTLPRPADVIISDLRGILPLFQHHIRAIADARRRLLAPGGVLIPRRDLLWAAPIEDPELYRAYREPWLENGYGLDLSAGHSFVINSWRKVNAKPERLLAAPQQWATLDYATIEQPGVAGELTWTVERAGTAHGFALWFDAELAEGIGFSNAPGQPQLVYGQAFFPLQRPVVLEGRDVLTLRLRADLVDDDYIWRWDTRVRAADGADRLKASFQQSSFFGAPLSLEGLKRRESGFIPSPVESARIDASVLSMLDGRRSLGEIATRLLELYPQRFARLQDALTHTADLLERYHEPP